MVLLILKTLLVRLRQYGAASHLYYYSRVAPTIGVFYEGSIGASCDDQAARPSEYKMLILDGDEMRRDADKPEPVQLSGMLHSRGR
jgi:hypothetical protein